MNHTHTDQHRVVILYDGLYNSVFASQVLEPLMRYHQAHPTAKITLISFERLVHKTIPKNIPKEFSCIQLQRSPFWGRWSLRSAQKRLKKVLSSLNNYHIIARGPFAGYIAAQAATAPQCSHITLQVRGLLAAEYEYSVAGQKNILKKIYHTWRHHLLETFEEKVYQLPSTAPLALTLEVVSTALKEYLVWHFHADVAHISIAQHDHPPLFEQTLLNQWRQEIRHQLHICDDTVIYCYNGSLKPWQCPEATLSFFKAQEKIPQKNFLLILSQDVHEFHALVQKYAIAQHQYKIITVAHHDIYKYLAAADIGIIFREPHVMNWISRPTKILEYQAVGLALVHNNTIEMITKQEKRIS